MADGAASKSSTGTVVKLLLFVGVLWLGYLYFSHAKLGQQAQFLGDPRTACVYPVEKIGHPSLSYTDTTGQPDSMDEFKTMGEAVAAGYRTCP